MSHVHNWKPEEGKVTCRSCGHSKITRQKPKPIPTRFAGVEENVTCTCAESISGKVTVLSKDGKSPIITVSQAELSNWYDTTKDNLKIWEGQHR